MTAPPVLLRPPPTLPWARPLDGVAGGAAALAATALAAMAALLFAAALAVRAVLALLVALPALAAARARGRAAGPHVFAARWTGCGWDAG